MMDKSDVPFYKTGGALIAVGILIILSFIGIGVFGAIFYITRYKDDPDQDSKTTPRKTIYAPDYEWLGASGASLISCIILAVIFNKTEYIY